MPKNVEVAPLHFQNAPVPCPDLDTHFVAYSARRKGFHASKFSVLPDPCDAVIFSQKSDDHPLLGKGFVWLSLREALDLSGHNKEVPQDGPEMLRHALERVLAASDKGYLNLYGPLLSYITRALEQPGAEETPEKVVQK